MALDAFAVEMATRLADALVQLARFLGSAAVVYLPARLLLLPAARRSLDRLAVSPTFELPFLKLLHAGSALIALFVGATVSGLAGFLTATAAITAGATIAVGFASRDVLSNLVSGVFIVLDPQFNIGDWIQWDGQEGIIEDISFRVTRVHSFDNELITIPNSDLVSNTVVNPVAKDRLRTSIQFGIGYDDDIDEARAVLVGVARDHPEVIDRPRATVFVEELAPSAITLAVYFWIENPGRTDLARIRSEFVQTAKERFDAADIDLPYPYLQLTGGLEMRSERGPTDRWPTGEAGDMGWRRDDPRRSNE